MKYSKANPSDHPPETLIAAYAIGKCSPAAQTEIDEHCFTCESCRTRLSILLRLSSLEDNELERREMERLFPLGKETIAQARQPFAFIPSEHKKNNNSYSSLNSSANSSEQFSSGKFFSSIRKLGITKRYRMAALTLLIAAIAGTSYYWYVKAHSPVQNSLLAMRRSFQLSRPLEARMSGELDYKPFARTRGNSESSDINRDQINYALAELTKVVASKPTPQDRHALGRLYLFLGEFDRAEEQMKIALESMKHDAKLHSDLAALYYERSNYADADPSSLLTQAVEHYKLAIEIDPQFPEAWFNRALCYEKLYLYSQAKEDWSQYLKIDSKSKWADEARERLKKLDARAGGIKDHTKEDMMALIEKAMTDDAALKSVVSQNIAAVMRYSNNNLFEQFLKADLNGDEQQAKLLFSRLKRIGEVVEENKGDRFITDLADLAARASPQMKNRMLGVHLKLRQADNEFSRSSHDAAFKFYQSAHLAAKRIGDELHTEIAASNLIRYSHIRTNSSSLIPLGNRLVLQTERLRHRYLQAQTHAALANAYLASQQGTLALENSLHASKIAKDIGDKDTTINGLIFAGAAYTRTGNYKLGINKSFEVLSIIKDYPVNQFRSFQAYQQIWEPLFRSGDYKLALDYQEEALRIVTAIGSQSAIAGSTGRIGLNLWRLNRNNEAENFLKTAITKCNSINDKTMRQLVQTELYATLGDVSLSLGKAEESLANYNFALQAIKSSNNSVYLSAIYQGMASAYLAQNKVAEAEQELRRSISLLEKGRQQIGDANGRSVFLARSQNAYHAMVDLQFYFNRDERASFDYAEIARNRDILDVLTQTVSPKSTDGRIVLSSKNSRPLKLKEVQSGMPRNAQMLSYALTEKGLIISHVTPVTFFSASVDVSRGKLKAIIADYLVKLRDRKGIEIINLQASELYHYLISPVLDRLDSNRPIYIIQDGVLNQLPFSTLYRPDTKRYLIEDYTIITNHSASVVVQTNALAKNKPHNSNETFLGISNPRFSYRRFPGLPALPSSEEEVSRACSLYQQSKFFSRESALESKTLNLLQNYTIVHFASHTINNAVSPLTSSILLAEEAESTNRNNNLLPGITFDGTLQAAEIYRLKLPRTQLVILSSCRSGIGDYTEGQAMGALVQAFFAAKVPSVIASLWDIDDAISAEVMYSFHYYHRNQLLGFAESLRQAQCSLLKGTDKNKQHPYYWAAFQFSGSDIRN